MAALAGLFLLSGCDLLLDLRPGPTPDGPLVGTAWSLAAIEADSLEVITPTPPTDGPYTVRFRREGSYTQEHRGMHGETGCNLYGGAYRTMGERMLQMRIEQATLQGCGHPTEHRFLRALDEATAYELDADTLRIHYERNRPGILHLRRIEG